MDQVEVNRIVERALVDWELVCHDAGVYVDNAVARSLLRPAMRVAVMATLNDRASAGTEED